MNETELRALVRKMRHAQREYFRSRDTFALEESKMLERAVDRELFDAGPGLFDPPKRERPRCIVGGCGGRALPGGLKCDYHAEGQAGYP